MLDLFCGRFGWSRAFAARGWTCTCVDLVRPAEIPENCFFHQMDVLDLVDVIAYCQPDFICASSPCEQFSVHCMKFLKKKDHPYPTLGIELFNHTRRICEESGLPYIMENVRCAEQFVGPAVNHANGFYLWGNSVPPILPRGFIKMGNQGGWWKGDGSFRERAPKSRKPAAQTATIPPELANCVCDYAERLLELTTSKLMEGRDPYRTRSSDAS